MDFHALTQTAVDFVRANQGWGFFVVMALAFGESLAFISLLVPATVILLGLGFLIGESGISFWPLWAAAAIGAFFGDWLSFWIGQKLEHDVVRYWPLSRNPGQIGRAHV